MNDKLHDWAAILDADIAAQPGEVLLTCGSDLKPQAVRWLWQYWLALGKFHILAGAPGQGKTTIAMAVAAIITIGGRWPDGSRCEPGNILVWSGEDDASDTLLPRLLAAGADPKRCYFITGTRVNGESVPFDPARDLGQLEAVIQKIGGIRLLIVDPVVSAVTGDSHKNTEVRRALQPLVDLAARCDCAVLGITHFSKGGQGTDPAQRVLGSVAFSAVARVVLVAARVKSSEEGEETRILARSKSNIGPDNGGFEYRLEQTQPIPGIEASRIAWGRAVEGTARELLTDPDEQQQDDSGDAVDLLRGELDAMLWTSSDTACEPLKAAGFSKKQIWQASKKLGVIRRKDGMKGGWLWSLPKGPSEGSTEDSSEDSAEDSTEDSEDSSYGNGESSESSGALESSEREVI
jgi:putative DNA primase/helicase